MMRRLALAQGAFNLLGGIWPLVSMRTFQAVFGRKVDTWLVYTVAGMVTTVGAAQVLSRTDSQLQVARVIGIGTSCTLLAVDLVNVPQGRIRPMYFIDAAGELLFLIAWARTGRQDSSEPTAS